MAAASVPVWAVLVIVAFRITNALSISTFFQPDEYFQALEPAFINLYGYGFRTWEWDHGLRGGLIPLIYSLLFTTADMIGLDILTFAKIVQGVVAAVGDIYTYKLARRFGESRDASLFALYASLTSATQWFLSTRSFSNTYEMVVTTVALTYWPFTVRELRNWNTFLLASVLAHLSIALRPTNAVLWLPLGITLVLSSWRNISRAALIVVVSLALAGGIHAANYELDVFYYGRNIFPMLNFLWANLGEQASHHYGVMPWHFYLSSAMPMLLLVHLPMAIYGLWQLGPTSKPILIIGSQVLIYSLLAHKEVRFFYFLLPLLHIAVGRAGSSYSKMFKVLTLLQLPVAYYIGHVHQRGVMDVIAYLKDSDDIKDTTFLMPCHSTPWRSHLRRPDMKARFLTCDPPVVVPPEMRDEYIDEADVFYLDPEAFLKDHPELLTQVLVVFDTLVKDINGTLQEHGYLERARFFNSHVHDDSRRRGDVVVLEKALST